MNDPCDTWPGIEAYERYCPTKEKYNASGMAKSFVIEPGTITEKDLADWQNRPGEIKVMKTPAPSFEEVFEAFDRWYWDKYQHHPPKMEMGSFYEFLKLNGVVK